MVRSTRKLAQAARKALGRAPQSASLPDELPPPVTKATPSKKASATKKTAPAKKAAPTKKAAATKTAAPAKKTAPARKAPAKKAPAKKAPAQALVVQRGESAWTDNELKEVLDELHEQQAHSTSIVTTMEAELTDLMRDSGDGAGHDQADVGASSFERDQELTVLSNERDKLTQIERALERIADGTYGVCELCEEPIGKNRVMAFPRATLCMTCKQREERR